MQFRIADIAGIITDGFPLAILFLIALRLSINAGNYMRLVCLKVMEVVVGGVIAIVFQWANKHQ